MNNVHTLGDEMLDVSITDNGQAIALIAHDTTYRFHAIWLRDNAQDAETRAAGNGQRLIALSDIPAQTTVSDAKCDGQTLHLHFLPENKTISYDLNWLIAHSYDAKTNGGLGWVSQSYETWGAGLDTTPYR